MEDPPHRTIFTIGHSIHELQVFIDLLTRHGITTLADVRSQPFSRIQHFNGEVLTAVLKKRDIKYLPLGRELGARRDEQECYVGGQAIYERIAQLPKFREGIDRLVQTSANQKIALMCAEKEPLDCHRTVLVCRHLRPHGLHIQHILASGELEAHAETERRMMKMMDIEPNLFQLDVTESDLIEQAYQALGKQIAYCTSTEEVIE
jgi:uncharacterized protein (DUF488 family)